MNTKDLRPKFLLVCVPLSLSLLLLSCKSDSQEASSSSTSDEQGKRTSHVAPTQQQAPKDTPVAPNRKPSKQSTKQNPSGGTTTAAPKTHSSKPYVLTDLSTIKVHPGTPSPKVGDTIYTIATIPANTCGEFWVQDKDGYVSKLAQCNGQHEGGH